MSGTAAARVRTRLERLREHPDPDTQAAAKAMLSFLALYEHDPHMEISASQLFAILTRHLLRDDEVFGSRPYQLPYR